MKKNVFDYDYMDALGLTYQVQDGLVYDNKSLASFEYEKTLEIIAFLAQVTPKQHVQNVFATLLSNALA